LDNKKQYLSVDLLHPNTKDNCGWTSDVISAYRVEMPKWNRSRRASGFGFVVNQCIIAEFSRLAPLISNPSGLGRAKSYIFVRRDKRF